MPMSTKLGENFLAQSFFKIFASIFSIFFQLSLFPYFSVKESFMLCKMEYKEVLILDLSSISQL